MRTNPFQSRSFLSNKDTHNLLCTLYDDNRTKSKFCHSIETSSLVEKFFLPDTPILKTTPPQLHILLGIVNNVQKAILEKLNEIQKKIFLASCNYFGIIQSNFWEGSLTGNNFRKLCANIDRIPLPCKLNEFKNVLKALDKICGTCFGIRRTEDYIDYIKESAHAWDMSGMSITYKVHT